MRSYWWLGTCSPSSQVESATQRSKKDDHSDHTIEHKRTTAFDLLHFSGSIHERAVIAPARMKWPFMNLSRLSIACCGAVTTLALSIAAAAPPFKRWAHVDLKNFVPVQSELRRDEAVFAIDLKHLRRDLRRNLGDARVTSDRRAAQADWTSILADRSPNAPSDSWQIELARRHPTAAPHRSTRG